MQDQQQPGWVFNPGQTQPQANQDEQVAPAEPAAPVQPQPPSPQTALPTANDGGISWTASEFIEHDKSGSWYAGSAFVAVVGIALVYFITRDLFSVIALSLFAVVFLAFAARKPNVLSYRLSDQGITIGEKFYSFGQFKSFAVIDEGVIHSISLLPLKRFMPALNIYFAPEDENKILDFLSMRMPHEIRKQDPVDRLMRKIRF